MKNQVITEFDKADIGGYIFFFNPDHGYVHIANSRISLFADKYRWAVVFEKNGYGNREFAVSIELDYFGNCLSNLDKAGLDDAFICNAKYFLLFDTDEVCSEDEDDFELLDPEVKNVKIREESIPVVHDIEIYWQHGIQVDGKRPSIIEFVYLVSETNPDILWATDDEIRTCIPDDLPLIGHIYEWHHNPETLYELPPSENEAYRLIAECIEVQSLEPFKPTLPPNNHRSNWPEAGGL